MARRLSKVSAVAGFTLIELMVTLVVAAILLAIAIPGYQTYIRQSRRTDAKTAVLDLAGREETLFSTKNTYSITPADVGYTGGAFPISVGSGYYTITVVAPAAAAGVNPTFLVTAVPVAGKTQANDAACQTFSVDQLGNQTALNAAGADNTVTCWGN
jgi:type IV pilus assembly protein PilE